MAPDLRIDVGRLLGRIEALGEIGAVHGPNGERGCARLALTDADQPFSRPVRVSLTVTLPSVALNEVVLIAVPEERLTELGTVMGSPPYMAPEQYGRAHAVTGKADVFALGVMLTIAAVGLDHDALEMNRACWTLPDDFERFELLGVYADGDTVFATMRIGLAGSPESMHLAEQFRFSGTRLVEVRVHICDPVPTAGRPETGRGG